MFIQTHLFLFLLYQKNYKNLMKILISLKLFYFFIVKYSLLPQKHELNTNYKQKYLQFNVH